ncbi:MAG: HipA domain-containing protein [Clostridia bacterium]|nr:HipA domain-containing protein [Clostridia bacterium]
MESKTVYDHIIALIGEDTVTRPDRVVTASDVTEEGEALPRFSSPDTTDNGDLVNRWVVIGGKRYLYKGGGDTYKQQPFNELIATKLMQRLNIPCVAYSVRYIDDRVYSVCEDMLSEGLELVSAWQIYLTKKKSPGTSRFEHFLACAEGLEIPGVRTFLDQMIVVDYIIGNEDRHFSNFAAIRNTKTKEWIRMAPLFDAGSTFGYCHSAESLRADHPVRCLGFAASHEEQLTYVSDFSWIDFSALEGLGALISEILSDENAKKTVGEDRIPLIAQQAENRVRKLKAFADSRQLREQQ